MTLLRNESFQVDDLPEHNQTYIDLKYFEKEMNGILPLEISIDTKKKKGLLNINTIKKIEAIEDSLKYFNCLSNGTSIADGLKIIRRAYYNGNPDYYSLPMQTELPFIMPYLKGNQEAAQNNQMAGNLLKSMVDSTYSRARIQMRVADIGTVRMVAVTDSIQKILDHYFPPEKNTCDITGTSVIFAFGSLKLIDNLVQSLVLAIILISLCMVGLFSSWRMVFISVIPNFIPLIVTAAIMGFFGIRLKSSTILVFNIAFGISVDNAIHLFTKFRHELDATNYDTPKSVIGALRETGVSIIYSAIILLTGFMIFCFSQFGGTIALGLLIDITLFVAMFTNLLFLPSMLMSFNINFKKKAKKE
ncbi:MAG: MMPL family transporter, partial [Bacteroidales bacterium]|nr:MMPL family transporter [Bacteroidales bacterium]